MTVYITRCLMAFACVLYIVFAGYSVGLAHDYETIGHGLIPTLALPLAVLMLALSAYSYRLAFVSYPRDDDEDEEEFEPALTWPTLHQPKE